jgi:NAD(P)-dependent dehydrogenase (short-subunit alcohol dehydrogenase family)
MTSSPPHPSESPSFLRWQSQHPPADPTTSYAGKNVLVTGSNTGLGFEAALKYATLGASTLVLGVRTLSKGQAAAKVITDRTSSPTKILVLELDMSSFTSVESFSKKLAEAIPTLDVAVLNAGVNSGLSGTREESASGWEIGLQVNSLSTAYLAILLLPQLRHTAATTSTTPHLEIVASFGHMSAKSSFLTTAPGESMLEKINKTTYPDRMSGYYVTKLLAMYIAAELTSATIKTPKGVDSGEPEIIVTTVCPGLASTELGRDIPWFLKPPMALLTRFLTRTAEQGSRTLVSGTALGKESHGKWWINDVFET